MISNIASTISNHIANNAITVTSLGTPFWIDLLKIIIPIIAVLIASTLGLIISTYLERRKIKREYYINFLRPINKFSLELKNLSEILWKINYYKDVYFENNSQEISYDLKKDDLNSIFNKIIEMCPVIKTIKKEDDPDLDVYGISILENLKK